MESVGLLKIFEIEISDSRICPYADKFNNIYTWAIVRDKLEGSVFYEKLIHVPNLFSMEFLKDSNTLKNYNKLRKKVHILYKSFEADDRNLILRQVFPNTLSVRKKGALNKENKIIKQVNNFSSKLEKELNFL